LVKLLRSDDAVVVAVDLREPVRAVVVDILPGGVEEGAAGGITQVAETLLQSDGHVAVGVDAGKVGGGLK
jgi:hypothetical protein